MQRTSLHYPTTGNPIVFFDFETTGLCHVKEVIIEVAAVKYVPGASVHPQMSSLIKIDRPLPRFISRLTGITDQMLNAEGRQMEDVLDEFIEFIGAHDVVAFNVNFDARFLNAALQRHGRKPLRNSADCALERARAAWPDLDSHKLEKLVAHLGLPKTGSHRALNDTLHALDVYFLASAFYQPAKQALQQDKDISTGAPSIIPVITGPGQFRIEALGTAKYQAVFDEVCENRTEPGPAVNVQATLRLERNSGAVRVLIQEDVVGNLAPRIAQDFRRAVTSGEMSEFSHFECSAKIRRSSAGDQQTFAMWLDIPQDDD